MNPSMGWLHPLWQAQFAQLQMLAVAQQAKTSNGEGNDKSAAVANDQMFKLLSQQVQQNQGTSYMSQNESHSNSI